MRALTILSVAAILIGCASAYVSQDQARDLESRWKNCSVVSRGRLGALHPVDAELPLHFSNTSYLVNADYYGCQVHPSTPSDIVAGASVDGYFVRLAVGDDIYWCDSPVDKDHIITFQMPTKAGEKATINAQYNCRKNNGNEIWIANVASLCYDTVPALLTNYTITRAAKAGETNVISMSWNTRDSCARFPYSGKAVPPGGVGAIIFVVIAFLLQFGAFAVYHKSHVDVSNLDEEGQMQ